MVKRPGVLSKVQMLTLVLGVGVFSSLPILASKERTKRSRSVCCCTVFCALFGGGGSAALCVP